MKYQSKRVVTTAYLSVSSLLLATGCGSSSDSASTPSLGLSGSLSAIGTNARISQAARSSVNRDDLARVLTQGGSTFLINYGLYHVHCSTSDAPPIEANGTIGSDGSFNVSIPNGLNKALSCDVLDSSDETIAAFVLKDTSKKDMNGNAQINDAPAFSAEKTNLGSLTMNLDTGDVVVPAGQVKDAAGNSAVVADKAKTIADPFDPSGNWTIAALDFTPPKGFGGPCAMGDQNCHGPPSGANLYLKRIKGVNTSDSSTVYGLQVWDDEQGNNPQAKAAACGDMTGLSSADQTNAGVDLSSYGAFSGAFTYVTSASDTHAQGGTATATITSGYKLSTARAQYTMQACSPKSITANGVTYNTYVCGPDSAGNGSPGGRYSAGLGGGCVNSAGAAISEIDWSQVTHVGGVCTPGTSALPGFYKNSCTATYQGQTITCTHEHGVFNDANLSVASTSGGGGYAPAFNHATVPTIMSTGQLCSAVSDPLAQVRCYADYYQNYGRSLAGCLPRVQTDWSTNVAADFVRVDFRPNSLVFMEKLNYADANTASMLTEQHQNFGVKVEDSSGNESWISCSVVEKGGLSFKKISENKMLATYVSAMMNTSTDKPACVGAEWNGQKEKFMFYITK